MSPALKISVFLCVAFLAQHGSANVKMCVDRYKAQEKCNAMNAALKETGREFECILDSPCLNTVQNGKADAAIIDADEHQDAIEHHNLEPVLYEAYDDDNVIVAVINQNQESKVDSLALDYDKEDLRELHSSLLLNHHRHNGVCKNVAPAKGAETIRLVRYNTITDKANQKLVCVQNGQLAVKPMSDFKTCNVEANIPNAVMVKKNSPKKTEIVNSFTTAANTVGHGANFQLFGEYKGKHDLIFSDDTKTLVTERVVPNGVTVEKFSSLHCGEIEHGDSGHGHSHSH